MTLSDFLQHHGLVESPFRGEEARSDSVFTRMRQEPAPGEAPDAPLAALGFRAPAKEPAPEPGAPSPDHRRPAAGAVLHSDFEKVLGDLRRPSPAIVFGEKGSGKTAIRLQIAERVSEYNARNPGSKILLIPYDDLNATLDRFHERVAAKSPLESFKKLRLVDHVDGMLHVIVPRLIDAILGRRTVVEPAPGEAEFGPEPARTARRMDAPTRRDLLTLQALYDRPESAEARTFALRQRLGMGLSWRVHLQAVVALFAPLVLVIAGAYRIFFAGASSLPQPVTDYALFGLLGLYALFLAKFLGVDRLMNLRLASKIRRQLRVVARGDISFARSLRQLDRRRLDPATLPASDSDEARYANLERLRRVARPFGFSGIFVVVDRVDEPTLVSGDPERMRAVVWPLLNNKFLSQAHVGVKMLLPIELRHALFKESSAFFQEARLDKQSLVDRLTWSGSMLYDLCDARLRACLMPGATPITLTDLFAEDTTRQDVVDALDQMHQPRDAFKLLYRCIADHCANVTREEAQWRIPRLVLDNVRKQESERVQQLHRGIRPA